MTEYKTIATNAHEIQELRLIAQSTVGEGTARGARITPLEVDGDHVRVGLWVGEPGTYPHAGATGGEAFVVLYGTGSLAIDGHEDVALVAGTVVALPANTPSVLTVTSTLRKIAVASGDNLE